MVTICILTDDAGGTIDTLAWFAKKQEAGIKETIPNLLIVSGRSKGHEGLPRSTSPAKLDNGDSFTGKKWRGF